MTAVWLTEFACPNPSGEAGVQEKFMADALAILDADAGVERYAWFAPHTEEFEWLGPSASLLTPDGKLSALGRIYLDEPAAGEVQPPAAVRAPWEGSWTDHCKVCWEAAPKSGNLTSGVSTYRRHLLEADIVFSPEEDLAQHCLDCGFRSSSHV